MNIIQDNVERFINGMYPVESGALAELREYAREKSYPIISNETAEFLRTMILIKQPKRVLEIGCCIGFSASLMAGVIGDDGHITTIDRYALMIGKAKETFRNLSLEDKVRLIEGDALSILESLVEDKVTFDFIFLDASKGQYKHFLPFLVQLLEVNGVMLADNILLNGDIARPFEEIVKRRRTIYRNMRGYLADLIGCEDLQSSVVPIGDGLTLSVKLR